MTPRLIWLISFPKSGNTWVRAFLGNYQNPEQTGWGAWADWHAAELTAFYDALGVEPSDLSIEELRERRPDYYRVINAAARGPLVVKVHDRYCFTPAGREMFPTEVTHSAVYLVRNPLDVVVSWHHHAGVSLDAAVEFVCDSQARLLGGPVAPRRQFTQELGSWSDHLSSWTSQLAMPIVVVRYEDLADAPGPVFRGLLQSLGLPVDEDRLQGALEASSFEQLRAKEDRLGFPERPQGMHRFFRAGRSGAWRGVLSPGQVERVKICCGPLMARFGYLEP